MRSRAYIPLTIATALAPSIASAEVLGQLVGYFNILTGLMIVVACLCFGSGVIVYASRIGLVGRELGIAQMAWGVTILFVLVIMLWGVRVIQAHPKGTMIAIALVVFVYMGKIVFGVLSATNSGGEGPEH